MLVYGAPAGFGPPRHLHRQDDEIFLIEHGTIVLWTPDECRTAGPGDVVMLPKGVPHTWRAYGNDPLRLQVTVTPGEFETFFERIVERNLTFADQTKLAEVAAAAGMDIVGPPLSDEEVSSGARRRAYLTAPSYLPNATPSSQFQGGRPLSARPVERPAGSNPAPPIAARDTPLDPPLRATSD